MYQHILIATDGSDLAGKAVSQGLALAKALNAKVTALNAIEPWTSTMLGEGVAFNFPIEEYETAAVNASESILAKVSEQAAASGVQCQTLHVSDFPADAIVQTAKDKGCDLIVMASHGRRGLARVLLGSQAIQVLTHTTVPVLVCR